ncbi:MAG TPA: class I poly(R)-hydroxyalkanoic acid synthase, partial [Rhodocyclaceae bacterium]|nr:class I poly(R)-hydroxyalkanoic acid synthase [Rhodocyclaceae bacterium]
MSQAQGSNNNDALYGSMMQFMQAGQSMAQHFLTLLGNSAGQKPIPEPKIDPLALTALQKGFVNEQMQLWESLVARGQGKGNGSGFTVSPEPGDRRFSAPEWKESPVYDYIHQLYLLNSRYVKHVVELLPAEDDKVKDRMRFLARQYIDAMAP